MFEILKMLVIILSILKSLLLPPIGLLLLAMLGLAFHKRKAGLPLARVSLLLLLILSLPFVVNKLARFWECFPALRSEQVEQFLPQAIVVIGGGLDHAASEYSSEWTVKSGTLLRLRYAAKLAKETGLPVLVSGGKMLASPDVSEARIMASVLQQEFTIPIVWQEAESQNTAENARLSRNMLRQQGIDRIILVTQAYHMPRAESEFRKAGFQVLPAPTAFIGRDLDFSLFDWMPSVRAFEHVFLLAHESLGMFWYWMRY